MAHVLIFPDTKSAIVASGMCRCSKCQHEWRLQILKTDCVHGFEVECPKCTAKDYTATNIQYHRSHGYEIVKPKSEGIFRSFEQIRDVIRSAWRDATNSPDSE